MECSPVADGVPQAGLLTALPNKVSTSNQTCSNNHREPVLCDFIIMRNRNEFSIRGLISCSVTGCSLLQPQCWSPSFAFLYHSSICTLHRTGLHRTDLGCQVDFCFSHVYHVSEQFASAISSEYFLELKECELFSIIIRYSVTIAGKEISMALLKSQID